VKWWLFLDKAIFEPFHSKSEKMADLRCKVKRLFIHEKLPRKGATSGIAAEEAAHSPPDRIEVAAEQQ
jgi:hypothetical protein